ncbi:very short patch repair endonuclease [Actinosynnema sp. NPDC020468]|uniref:very short patch repair endonuclease n=1 Tax=Actinosynnema sp. NPDC020468 TaxID=3154488 RepID=UPI0033F3B337
MSTTAKAGWNDRVPSDRAWKARPGRNKAAVSAEQDRAAGGKDRRWIDLGDGRFARASVELKVLPRTRRIRAYLRWYDSGRSPTRYLGEVDGTRRAGNLADGWRIAGERGFLTERPLPEDSWAASPAVRSSMRGNRGKDTTPELRLRRMLYREGLRYRVGVRPVAELRRTADVVFTSAKVAVFVDGCFWHGCPEHHRPARTNSDFWREKIEGNRRRDDETDEVLRGGGWTVVRIWEHEDAEPAADRIASIVRSVKT